MSYRDKLYSGSIKKTADVYKKLQWEREIPSEIIETGDSYKHLNWGTRRYPEYLQAIGGESEVWDSGTTYDSGDGVYYDIGGGVICYYTSAQDNNLNHLPTDTDWWYASCNMYHLYTRGTPEYKLTDIKFLVEDNWYSKFDESFWEVYAGGDEQYWDGSGWVVVFDPSYFSPVGTWHIGYRPEKIKIFFTGIATIGVNITAQRGDSCCLGVAMCDEASVTSGQEITLDFWDT